MWFSNKLGNLQMATRSQPPGGISPFFLKSSWHSHCGEGLEWSQVSSSPRTGAADCRVLETKMLAPNLFAAGTSLLLLLLGSNAHTTWKRAARAPVPATAQVSSPVVEYWLRNTCHHSMYQSCWVNDKLMEMNTLYYTE